MLLLLGNSRMAGGNFSNAIQLFERAQDQARYQTRYYTSQPLLAVSLVGELWLYCSVLKHFAIFNRYVDVPEGY